MVVLLVSSTSAQDSIRQHIIDLNDEHHQIRQDAEDKIISLGVDNLNKLEEELNNTNEIEVKLRIKRIINKLKEERLWIGSNQEKRKSSLILSSNKLGFKYSNNYEGSELVEIKQGKTIEVIDNIAKQLNGKYEFNTIEKETNNIPDNYYSYNGPFRLKISSLERVFKKTIDPPNKITYINNELTIYFKLDSEPNTYISSIGQAIAVAKTGSKIHTNQKTTLYNNYYPQFTYTTLVKIPTIINESKIDELTVSFPILLVGEPETKELQLKESIYECDSHYIEIKDFETSYVVKFRQNQEMPDLGFNCYKTLVGNNQFSFEKYGEIIQSKIPLTKQKQKIKITYPTIFSRKTIEFRFSNIELPTIN